MANITSFFIIIIFALMSQELKYYSQVPALLEKMLSSLGTSDNCFKPFSDYAIEVRDIATSKFKASDFSSHMSSLIDKSKALDEGKKKDLKILANLISTITKTNTDNTSICSKIQIAIQDLLSIQKQLNQNDDQSIQVLIIMLLSLTICLRKMVPFTLYDFDRSISYFDGTFSSMRQSLAGENNAAFAKTQDTLTKHSDQLSNIDKKLSETDKNVQNLNKKLCGVENTVNKHSDQLSNIDKKLSETDKTVQDLNEKLCSVENTVNEHSNQLSSINEKLSETDKNVQDLNEKLCGVEKTVKEHSNQLSNIKKELSETNKNVQNLNKKLCDVEQTFKEQNKKIEDTMKEQFDAIKQLIESKSNDSMLQKQNSILIKYMSNSFSNFQEAKEELSQMFQ